MKNNFNNIIPSGLSANQVQRIGRRDILPASVKGRFLPQDLMFNTVVERASAVVSNGSKVTLTSTITAADNPDRKVGHLPYMVQVYIGSATINNILPSGSNIDTNDYDVYSWDVPQVTGGTDGNNIVRKTTVANKSGSDQTIIFDVGQRLIIAGPGSQSTS